LLQARDRGLYRSFTDNGAGGLSSSVGEMARDPGGCEIWLERVPLKYPGLDPWEILLSESQERMTLAVPPEKLSELLALCQKMEVEATVIGRFTSSGKFHCLWKGKTVAYLDMEFFHEGLPRMRLEARWRRPSHPEPSFDPPEDLSQTLKGLLSRLNIASKEWVVRQYDHEVQGGSACKPLVGRWDDGPQDAAIVRPLLDSLEGVVVSHGICPRYSDIDTYWMAACALEEAIRNNVAAGGDPERMAALDNFCWPDPISSEENPDGSYKLAQLVRANKALYDFTRAFLVPCISGKDSMKNDYVGGGMRISVPPTLLFTVISKIDDVRCSMTMDAKEPGHLVYVLGMTYPELGASEYFAMMGALGNRVPRVRPEVSRQLFLRLHRAIKEGLVASCHDCSDGGLGVALAETAFAGDLGMEVDLRAVPRSDIDRDDYLLFSESQGRFVVTIPPERKKAFENIMVGLPFAEVGKVSEHRSFKVLGLSGKVVIDCPIDALREAWKKPFGRW
ncbi:MAG: phosphoribosylformylglycinamidine synthase, partial [Deltaproteobacteria bacterium]